MSEQPVPEYRVMLATDIEDYSIRADAEQQVLQDALVGTLDEAADAAALNPAGWLRQFSGDGVFAIMPHGTNVTRLMDRFVRELDAGLAGYNRRRREQAWTRMRLRLAVHVGPVYLDGPTGWPGQHAVIPGRLRDSEPVRAALAACPGADLAVIVSSEIYRDYVTQGPGNPRPTAFRSVLARVKKQECTAYLFVPGFDVHAIATLAEFDPPAGTSPTRTTRPLPETAGAQVPTGASSQPDLPSSREDLRPVGTITVGRNVIGRVSQRVSGGGDANFAGGDIHPPARPSREPHP